MSKTDATIGMLAVVTNDPAWFTESAYCPATVPVNSCMYELLEKSTKTAGTAAPAGERMIVENSGMSAKGSSGFGFRFRFRGFFEFWVLKLWGLRFRGCGEGFWDWGLGFGFQGLRLRVEGLGFRFQGLRFRI